MKKLYLLFLSIITVPLANAQNPIPNPGFETYWNFGTAPNGWTDSRDVNQVAPGCYVGLYSLQGIKTANTYPAFITSANDVGIPISTDYTFFHLYYAFNQNASDKLTISVTVRNASNASIGFGFLQGTSGGCRAATIPISYTGTGAASVVISVLMTKSDGISTPTVGSYFYLDNLLLNNSPTGISDIEKESPSLRIFPNPAANYVQIEADGWSGKTADVLITDMTGRTVRKISGADFSVGNLTIQLSDLPAGNYSLAIKNDEMVQTKRLVIE